LDSLAVTTGLAFGLLQQRDRRGSVCVMDRVLQLKEYLESMWVN